MLQSKEKAIQNQRDKIESANHKLLQNKEHIAHLKNLSK